MSVPGTENRPSSSASPPSMIYLDSNATTPMLPEVWEAMRPFLSDTFGNPASAHQVGRKARKARNPRTGERVDVEPKSVVTFKPGKEMEEKVRKLDQAAALATVGAAQEATPAANEGNGAFGKVARPARKV